MPIYARPLSQYSCPKSAKKSQSCPESCYRAVCLLRPYEKQQICERGCQLLLHQRLVRHVHAIVQRFPQLEQLQFRIPRFHCCFCCPIIIRFHCNLCPFARQKRFQRFDCFVSHFLVVRRQLLAQWWNIRAAHGIAVYGAMLWGYHAWCWLLVKEKFACILIKMSEGLSVQICYYTQATRVAPLWHISSHVPETIHI